MWDGLSQIIAYLTQMGQYILSIVESMIMGLVFLASSLTFPQILTGYMPSIIGTSILCTVAVFVFKFLVGR